MPSVDLDPEPITKVSTIEARSYFPALSRRQGDYPVAYFDAPGGTQVPRPVVEAMTDYLYHHNANTHWNFPTSQETDAIVSEARSALGDFLNCRPTEIAFGANMSTLTFHLARSLGRGMRPGDEIIVTELDHHANIDPWRAIALDYGVTIKSARMDRQVGTLDLDHLASLITPATKLLAIGAASNALGTISDVAAAAGLAHQVGALVFVDAVHYAAHRLIDVQAMGCDFLACSAYKFYGPHLGVLFGKHELVAALNVPKLAPAPNSAPERLETGTGNFEAMAGAAAAVDFLASLGQGANRRARLESSFAHLHHQESNLLEQLWKGLNAIESVKVFGPPPSEPRTATVSFAVTGVPSAEVATSLAEQGVFVSHGDFYATTAVDLLGYTQDGLVRVGCALYTTSDEVDRLVQGVGRIAGSQQP